MNEYLENVKLIFTFLDVLAFRFLSFIEKYILGIPISCCCWLGRANIELSLVVFLDKELSNYFHRIVPVFYRTVRFLSFLS